MDSSVASLLTSGDHPAFVTRFQQTTPPVMAKGVEDTAFYRYGRLLALNDVGGDPSRWRVSVDDFHAANAERASRFPRGLLTTMTHDAKRSHDVRARIAALSSVADEWIGLVRSWFELNEPLHHPDSGPDRIEEYFVYQTLAGAWPIEPDRLEGYLEKAMREAKRNSNWIEPDLEWEDGVKSFARKLYDHEPFLDSFIPFSERLADVGRAHVLRQVALKFTVPGLPDTYNGDELEYRALVDPDNRRPVDWDERRRLLEAGDREAAPKLMLIRDLLAIRAERPDAFAGSYEPFDAGEDTIAFIRGGELLVAVNIRSEDGFAAPDGWEPILADRPGVTLLRRTDR